MNILPVSCGDFSHPILTQALFHVLVVTNSLCLAVLVAVVVHLRRHFTPATGSIRAAQLARRESTAAKLVEDRDHRHSV